jgi:hypothetical protein
MDYDTFSSLLGEGFHTGFRKAVDSSAANRAWHAIQDMPAEDWGAVVTFVAEPTWQALGDDPPAASAAQVGAWLTRLVDELTAAQGADGVSRTRIIDLGVRALATQDAHDLLATAGLATPRPVDEETG